MTQNAFGENSRREGARAVVQRIGIQNLNNVLAANAQPKPTAPAPSPVPTGLPVAPKAIPPVPVPNQVPPLPTPPGFVANVGAGEIPKPGHLNFVPHDQRVGKNVKGEFRELCKMFHNCPMMQLYGVCSRYHDPAEHRAMQAQYTMRTGLKPGPTPPVSRPSSNPPQPGPQAVDPHIANLQTRLASTLNQFQGKAAAPAAPAPTPEQDVGAQIAALRVELANLQSGISANRQPQVAPSPPPPYQQQRPPFSPGRGKGKGGNPNNPKGKGRESPKG